MQGKTLLCLGTKRKAVDFFEHKLEQNVEKAT